MHKTARKRGENFRFFLSELFSFFFLFLFFFFLSLSKDSVWPETGHRSRHAAQVTASLLPSNHLSFFLCLLWEENEIWAKRKRKISLYPFLLSFFFLSFFLFFPSFFLSFFLFPTLSRSMLSVDTCGQNLIDWETRSKKELNNKEECKQIGTTTRKEEKKNRNLSSSFFVYAWT